MTEALDLPPELSRSYTLVCDLLAEAPQTVTVGDATYEFASPSALPLTQQGYSVSPEGEDLTGSRDGEWRAAWLVVGWDEDLSDPLFVDLAEDALPVFTAMHGAGKWEPEPVAPSLATLLTS